MLAALAQVYQEHYKDPIQTFVLDFLVHWLGYLLGALSEAWDSPLRSHFATSNRIGQLLCDPSYLKGGSHKEPWFPIKLICNGYIIDSKRQTLKPPKRI